MEARMFVLAALLSMVAGCAAPDTPRRAAASGPYYEEIKTTPPVDRVSLLPYCNVR